MNFTYYKSTTDDGGAIGDPVSSGTLGEIFNEVSAIELLLGLTEYRKIWIESDTDGDIYNYMDNAGLYNGCIFRSANPGTDTIANITGSEEKYGPTEIVIAADNSVIVEFDNAVQSYNQGDVIRIGDKFDTIDSFTDNADGTATIGLAGGLISPESYVGLIITPALKITVSTGVPQAIWIKLVVPSVSVFSLPTDTIPLTTMY